MIIDVNVTSQHIRDGIRLAIRLCPVALALKDALPEGYDLHGVTMSMINIDDIRIKNPAGQFVWDFDNYMPVEPMSFKLELPVRKATDN